MLDRSTSAFRTLLAAISTWVSSRLSMATSRDEATRSTNRLQSRYRKAGEVGIPRLVFIVKEGTAWPTNLLDAIVSEDHGRRIHEFRSELKKEHTDSFFESP